jgi:prepilin-type N-terminal cleavage/methylation domain-containing protein
MGDTMNQERTKGLIDRGARGFSLPELLAVMALIALMVLFAGPAIADAYRGYQARAAANNLVTNLRALRYNAVANRAPQTVTLHDEDDTALPNHYVFTNLKGQPMTVGLDGARIEAASPASITFNINGGTGTSAQTIIVERDINTGRGDRYTITVTPTGTIQTSYGTYTP